MLLSVIVPVYNEVHTIREIITRIDSVMIDKQIIIVDDYSTDGTRRILTSLPKRGDLTVLFHDKNRGKGAAIRTALQAVTGQITIIQDADLEYDPQEYHALIQPIIDGRADVVYGSRFLGGPHRVLYFWHFIGNRFLTLLSNILTNINLTDMETCYKAFKSDIVKAIPLKLNRFGFEPEFTAKIARRKLRIYEVPISYSGRTYEEGKKITWKDGIKAVAAIIRFGLVD